MFDKHDGVVTVRYRYFFGMENDRQHASSQQPDTTLHKPANTPPAPHAQRTHIHTLHAALVFLWSMGSLLGPSPQHARAAITENPRAEKAAQ